MRIEDLKLCKKSKWGVDMTVVDVGFFLGLEGGMAAFFELAIGGRKRR